jgi:hypothetical protein
MTEILNGRNDSASVRLDPRYSNRHRLITEAERTALRGVLGGIFGGKR